jgi:arylsulfatase A-like enzyme
VASIGRCLLDGAGFGLAMAAVEVWANAARLLSLGMRPPLPVATRDAAMIVALAALVGVATIGAARRGRGWHSIAMGVVWIAIQAYAAPADRQGRTLAFLMPVGGLVLTAIGARMGRRARWAPGALGVAAVVLGIVAPEAAARLHTAPPRSALPPAPPDAPDVVLIVLDGVRADHLGAYGYTHPTSPKFDALARDGALFLDAVAPGTWSLPTHASLFTGRFVSAHRAHDEHMFLEPRTPTLAERFAAAGYDTRLFSADASITDSFGMTRGFRWTDEAWRHGELVRTSYAMHRLLDRVGLGGTDESGAHVASNVEQWLVSRPVDDRPAFTLIDVGGGTLPVAGDAIEQVVAKYDAGIARADVLLGRIVQALRRRGSLDRTILVVLADHGALLGEHGAVGTGYSPYEPVLHVPLLVRYPKTVLAGRRLDTPVSTVGVYATLLELARLPREPSAQVGSLTAVLRGEPHPGPIIAEHFAATAGNTADLDDPLLEKRARFRVYRVGRRKLVDAEPGGTFLFDLDADPGEEHDVAMKKRRKVGQVREQLDDWRERLGIPDLRAPAE